MLALRLAAAAFTCIRLASASAIFRWPDPLLDEVDHLLYGANFLAPLPLTCNGRDDESTFAAQWVRLAYHDMATHNADDGTGGLDASIIYELDRPQNVGQGMSDSLEDFETFPTSYVSFADLIAMGVVFSVAGCGGPIIPYRAGRKDARSAGPATVPEPQQDLASHTESFRRQGFTQSEMIALVACGHSLGGVRQADFPTIVPAETSFATFASDIGFSNLVVRQYLDGSSANPLAVGFNTTTNSDFRIFSSDKNATMQSLATGSNFNTTCQNLLARMINTVPKDVKLTEPVDPIPFKVTGVQLYPQNGSLILNARLRFLHANPKRVVTIHWKEKHGSFCHTHNCSAEPQSELGETPSFIGARLGLDFAFKSFSANVDLNTSVSQFWFQIDEHNGLPPYRVDNHGLGYVLDDNVLFDPSRTDLIFEPDFATKIVVAVKGATSSTKVSLETHTPGTSLPFLPVIKNVDMVPDPDNPPSDGYTFYAAKVDFGVSGVHVQASTGGKDYRLYVNRDEFGKTE